MNANAHKVKMLLISLGIAGVLLALSFSLILAQVSFLIRITTASDADRVSASPSLNAEGTKIAFTSDSDFLGQGIPEGQCEIWLHDTTTLALTRITTASHADRCSHSPSLSADGTRIAFTSDSDFLNQGILDNRHELWLYDTTSMSFTRIIPSEDASDLAIYPILSGDGTKIAFHSNRDFLGQGIPDSQVEIWLYDTAAMTLTRITTASAPDRGSFNPSLSADGSKIAFQSSSDLLGQGIPDDQLEIWLYDTSTMTFTRVTTASAAHRYSVDPSLSGDGTKIAFSSDSDFLGQGIPESQFELWLYDTSTMTLTRIITSAAVNQGSYFPKLSSDGSKVTFISRSDLLGQGIPVIQRDLWLYDTNTMTLTRITTSVVDMPTIREGRHSPSLNEDGSRIAFASDSYFYSSGVPAFQRNEIWLYKNVVIVSDIYLPVALKN